VHASKTADNRISFLSEHATHLLSYSRFVLEFSSKRNSSFFLKKSCIQEVGSFVKAPKSFVEKNSTGTTNYILKP
jgi:hypothetical protein